MYHGDRSEKGGSYPNNVKKQSPGRVMNKSFLKNFAKFT